MMPQPIRNLPRAPWYASTSGKIFLVIIAFIITATVAFLALTGYYVWQIRTHGVVDTRQAVGRARMSQSTQGAAIVAPRMVTDYARYIRPQNPTIGAANAPVTIIVFIDFECPYCREAHPTFGKIMTTYAPVVRVVFKHFPITTIHPSAEAAAHAAHCAHAQGKFWAYYDRLFETKTLDQASLTEHARVIGLDTAAFASCRSAQKFQSVIDQDLNDAVDLNLRGTPTYIVNGQVIEGTIPEDIWHQLLAQEIRKQTP